MNKWITADFETLASDEAMQNEETYVWAWAYYDIHKDDFKCGNTITSMFNNMAYRYREFKVLDIYFHNLKFDGSFIINWLSEKGYEELVLIEEDRKLKIEDGRKYKTLISKLGQYYLIEFFYKGVHLRILNSLNLLNFSVSQISKSLGLAEVKGEIDYKLHRDRHHKMTDEEKEYIKNDVVIVAKALEEVWFSKGFDKMTVGSNALRFCKNQLGTRIYNQIKNSLTPEQIKKMKPSDYYELIFPKLSDKQHKYIKEAYKGGFCFIMGNKDNQEYINVDGSVFDYNSMYPSMMKLKRLPCGKGKFFTVTNNNLSEYKDDLYVIRFSCKFELKDRGLPIYLNDGNKLGLENGYIESSQGKIIESTMTNIDFYHFNKNYKLENLIIYDGYAFDSCTGMFDDYINHWGGKKIECGKNGDKAGKQLAKLMLNSLTGKFATSEIADRKTTKVVDGVLKYEEIQGTKRTEYIPLTTFITAWSRHELFETIYANYDNFLYCDTDSVHLKCPKEEAIIPNQHQEDFGNWKFEYSFTRARYLKRKCYIEEDERIDMTEVRCGGLSSKYHKQLNFENFKPGHEVDILRLKQVVGGQLLVEGKYRV